MTKRKCRKHSNSPASHLASTDFISGGEKTRLPPHRPQLTTGTGRSPRVNCTFFKSYTGPPRTNLARCGTRLFFFEPAWPEIIPGLGGTTRSFAGSRIGARSRIHCRDIACRTGRGAAMTCKPDMVEMAGLERSCRWRCEMGAVVEDQP